MRIVGLQRLSRLSHDLWRGASGLESHTLTLVTHFPGVHKCTAQDSTLDPSVPSADSRVTRDHNLTYNPRFEEPQSGEQSPQGSRRNGRALYNS